MIQLENLTVSYGGETVLKNCSLHLARAEHAALMGPSGCGKTTLLNIVAGLVKPRQGTVHVGGSIAYVFQEPRLFPWLTARQNISEVLNRPDAGDAASAWLQLAGLAGSGDKYPNELSGGMRQRIAICRALAADREILLLDEPLKGLDAARREELTQLIRRHTLGKTLLLVTHDSTEAAALADTVYEYHEKTFVKQDFNH